jgi:hypothetical protein
VRQILQVQVQWEPGKEFKNLIDDAEFNLVASRSAQAAVLKAIKEGKSNVDLNLPIDPDGGDDGNGGSTTTGGGSNAGGSGTTGSEGGGTTGSEGGNKGDTGTSGGNTDAGSNGDNVQITL